MGDQKGPVKKEIPGWLNFVIGGASGMLGICVVQPADLIKTRMQLMGPAGKTVSAISVASNIVKTEGVLGLYSGISAALFRQATYTTGRLGCFGAITDSFTSLYGTPGYLTKIAIGMVSGGIGAFFGNPAEVALIRMTADGRLPPEKRRNYTHIFNALGRFPRDESMREKWSKVVPGKIVKTSLVCSKKFEVQDYGSTSRKILKSHARPFFQRFPRDESMREKWSKVVPGKIVMTSLVCSKKFEVQDYDSTSRKILKSHARPFFQRIISEEGASTLLRGVGATVTRAMVVNGAQLSTYAQAREMLLPILKEGIFLHFCSSMISGLVTSFASLPVDIVKTRVQNAAKGTGQLTVLKNVIANEGVFALWSGFLPTFFKIGPHTVFTFIFLEQLKKLYFSLN